MTKWTFSSSVVDHVYALLFLVVIHVCTVSGEDYLTGKLKVKVIAATHIKSKSCVWMHACVCTRVIMLLMCLFFSHSNFVLFDRVG